MRGKLEEDHHIKRKMMEKATKDVNLQLVIIDSFFIYNYDNRCMKNMIKTE